MSYLKVQVDPRLQAKLTSHGLGRRKTVSVREESLNHFTTSLAHGYPRWTTEELQREAIICCLTHPQHRDLHRTWYKQYMRDLKVQLGVVVAIACIILMLASLGHCQQSQIDVITFKTSTGTVVRTFASPFTIKAGTGITFTNSGPTLTINSSGGSGGGGYETIQNAGVALAAETALNFLGSFSCVDNPGLSTDCKLSASAAVSHQFVTGVDASGNYLRATILAADVPTLNQSTTGNAATATALAANPTDCAANQYATAIDTGANLTCAQVGYAQVTGTPTLRYQTVQDEGVPLAQEPLVNFTGAGVTCVDNAGIGTNCAIPGGGGTAPTGTGFTHITTGAQDSAAKTVDVSSADITGTLKAAAEPAHTGDVTNTAGSLALAIAAGAVTRADLASDALGMQFLGTTTPLGSANATLGPLTLIAKRKHMQIRGFIASYAANGVAGLQLANVTTIDTGTNYAVQYISAATTTVTAAASTTAVAMRVSNTLATAGRSFVIDLDDYGTGQVKRVHGRTNSISTSSGTAPTQDVWEALWSNTTAGVGAMQFTALNSLTAGTATTTTFGIGSYFSVWGRDDN